MFHLGSVFKNVLKNESGVTLAELMVSLGISSLAMVTLASLFSQNAVLQARSQNEARLEEGISEFVNQLETSLGNTSRVFGCGCGGADAPLCTFAEIDPLPYEISPDCLDPGGANPCGAGAVDATGDTATELQLVVFETEDNPEPSNFTYTQCFGYTAGIADPVFAGQDWIPQGCKQVYEIRAIAPIKISAARPAGAPGVLQINRCSNYDPGNPTVCTPLGQPRNTVASLQGVYSVRCGHTSRQPNPALPTTIFRETSGFRFDVKAKALNDTFNEGWSPLDPRFSHGLHRTISLTTLLRNMAVRGVHFGKMRTDRCAPDGANATAFSGNCCSGYRLGTTCLSVNQCRRSGVAVAADADFVACCSHQLVDISGARACL
jgi:Flp pilus assembly pilin Flp